MVQSVQHANAGYWGTRAVSSCLIMHVSCRLQEGIVRHRLLPDACKSSQTGAPLASQRLYLFYLRTLFWESLLPISKHEATATDPSRRALFSRVFKPCLATQRAAVCNTAAASLPFEHVFRRQYSVQSFRYRSARLASTAYGSSHGRRLEAPTRQQGQTRELETHTGLSQGA